MTLEVTKALLLLAKICVSACGCECCPLKEFCGKIPSEW